MRADEIASVRIHPAIGIARVGNSSEYFVGPEAPWESPPPKGGFKHNGALKRQAARFRVYGYDRHGKVIGELTPGDSVRIEWTVHLANKKAAWYDFDRPLDIPESATLRMGRRNAKMRGAARQGLVIDPGSQTLAADARGPVRCDGCFLGTPVYLGELRLDASGRLMVLGGLGASGTPLHDNPPSTFANNTGWYDDTSDGPVTARVVVGDREFTADPAWVVVAPPNYAPDIVTVQSMYDVVTDALKDVYVKVHEKPSFTRDILPIFRNLCDAQWVNQGFYTLFGYGAPYEFMRPDMLKKLSRKGTEYKELRKQIFRMFRQPDGAMGDPFQWPPIYGDAAFEDGVPATDSRNGLAITALRYGYLKKWVDGDFTSDYDCYGCHPATIEDVSLTEQPETLDRAALHYCMGGPFHPGCEMTWPMRMASMYRGAYRLKMRPADRPEPDYGDYMTQEIVKAADGPLSCSGPGDLTRWMAVPWQTDTASCLAGYEKDVDTLLPAFWPARVPNHVLTEADYDTAIHSTDREERIAAFNRRDGWLRQLHREHASYREQIARMVREFGELGVVEKRPGRRKDADVPEVVYVEIGARQTGPAPAETPHIAAPPPGGPDFRQARFGKGLRAI